eukprot:g930.t1
MANTFAAFAKNLLLCNRPAFNRAAADIAHYVKAGSTLRLLDVGASGGEPSVTIAKNHPQSVHVVSTDLAAENKEIGENRARYYGVENIEFHTADACDLSQFENQSFDALSAQLVYMFVPDLEQSCRECHRVLKPGSPLMATVWQEAEKCHIFQPWGMTIAALREEGTLPPAQPGEANPVVLANQCPDGVLGDALRNAGFSNVAAEEMVYPIVLPGNGPQDTMQRFLSGTPFLGILRDAGGDALVNRASQMMADYALAIGVEEVNLSDADTEWKGVDLGEGLKEPVRALRFPSNTALWVTATA